MIRYDFPSHPILNGLTVLVQLDLRGSIITVTGDFPCHCGQLDSAGQYPHRTPVSTHYMVTAKSFADHKMTSVEWMIRGDCSNARARAQVEAEKLTLHIMDKYKGTCSLTKEKV